MESRVVVSRILESIPQILRWASDTPGIRTIVNRVLINQATLTGGTRPRPLSLWGPTDARDEVADYISWSGLVDRVWTGRHLPPADSASVADLPSIDTVVALFKSDVQQPCSKSTALFTFFAQWFTDSFLRTDATDSRKNTSNHEIDLCQIYGLNAADTALLKDETTGRLKSQMFQGHEYPAALCDPSGDIKAEFEALSFLQPQLGKTGVDRIVIDGFTGPPAPKHLFATGLERGNQSIYYAAISTVFLREHNRLCALIEREFSNQPHRVFELARNTNIAQILKIIIENYINHISSNAFRLFLDIGFPEDQKWYRTNRIAAEFDLLYRWHSLTPGRIKLDGREIEQHQFRYNNTLLLQTGVEGVISAAANMRAGRIGLCNTPDFLLAADRAAVVKSRDWKLRSYNDYREHFKLGRCASFDELTRDDNLAALLAKAYKDIDRVELMVGLLAEWRGDHALFGDLMGIMVATDAFSQALTNPLLAKVIYGEQAFSKAGLASLEATSSFDQMVERNSRLESGNASFGSPRLAIRPSTIATPLIPSSVRVPFLTTAWETVRFFFGGDVYLGQLRERYRSDVFRVNFFRPTIAILDPEAIPILFDAKTIRQDHGFGWAVPPPPLIGNVVPTIFESGPAHQQQKSFYIDLMRMRLPDLIPVFEKVAERFEASWISKRKFGLRVELERLSATFVFEWLLRMEPDPDQVGTLYLNLFNHPFYRVFKTAAYRRSLSIYQTLLNEVLASDRLEEVRGLAARHGMTHDVAARQLLFVTGMNAFLGIQNVTKSVLAEIGSRPKLIADLRSEIMRATRGHPVVDLSSVSPAAMPLLDRTLREVLRLHSPVSFLFGRPTADRTIDVSGQRYTIRKDELLMGVVSVAQRSDRLFTRGDNFNPYRLYGSASSKGLIWPRGFHDDTVTSTDRTCPAKDSVVVFVKLLCIRLLSQYQWTFDEQPVWNPKSFTLNRSAPVGDLAVHDFLRLKQ